MLVPTINAKAEVLDFSDIDYFDYLNNNNNQDGMVGEKIENGFKFTANLPSSSTRSRGIDIYTNRYNCYDNDCNTKIAYVSFDYNAFTSYEVDLTSHFKLSSFGTSGSSITRFSNNTEDFGSGTFSSFIPISNDSFFDYPYLGISFSYGTNNITQRGSYFTLTNFRLIVGNTEEEIMSYLNGGTEESSEESSEEESSSDIVIHDSTLNVILYALVFMFDLVIVLVLLRGIL